MEKCRTWKLSAAQKKHVKDFWVLGPMWWEWMKAVLSSAISAWKQGLEVLFFPRCWPVLRLALRGETLPKLGQAGQKQMRSDTGGKQSLPEPLQAHITKCSTPEVALFCEHPSCRDYWHGMSVFFYFSVFAEAGSTKRSVWVRFKSTYGDLWISCLYFSTEPISSKYLSKLNQPFVNRSFTP